jgi:hypothetical protein
MDNYWLRYMQHRLRDTDTGLRDNFRINSEYLFRDLAFDYAANDTRGGRQNIGDSTAA